MAIKADNETIIAALIEHGTIRAAATAAGVTPRTIYSRMKKREFRAAYMEAKNDILRTAVFEMNRKLSAAIITIGEIMQDKDAKPEIRLQAAQTIIKNAGIFSDRLAADEKTSYTTANPSKWELATEDQED